MSNGLRQCTKNQNHYYSGEYGRCHWCERVAQGAKEVYLKPRMAMKKALSQATPANQVKTPLLIPTASYFNPRTPVKGHKKSKKERIVKWSSLTITIFAVIALCSKISAPSKNIVPKPQYSTVLTYKTDHLDNPIGANSNSASNTNTVAATPVYTAPKKVNKTRPISSTQSGIGKRQAPRQKTPKASIYPSAVRDLAQHNVEWRHQKATPSSYQQSSASASQPIQNNNPKPQISNKSNIDTNYYKRPKQQPAQQPKKPRFYFN